jgi:hypothetical protein
MSSTAETCLFGKSLDEPLQAVLLRDYLCPTANWLLGPPESDLLLATHGNSAWESAMSIWFLLDLRNELADNPQLEPLDLELIDRKLTATAAWLVDQADAASDERPFWEGVTWDTAVVVRTLARLLNEHDRTSKQCPIEDICELCSEAIAWLIHRFRQWDQNVTYPLGPSDLAQVLNTLVYIKANISGDLQQALTRTCDDGDIDSAIEDLVRYLLGARDEDAPAESEDAPDRPATKLGDGASDDTSSEPPAFWGDYFQSGEVIESLVGYVNYLSQAGRPDPDEPSLSERCQAMTLSCICHLEAHQVDGRWGTHSDTCRALYAYLRTTAALQDVGQEDHVVLKALRWMCDQKQTFADGSFMHTMFVTVFYALALWQVYAKWAPATQPAAQVYDYAFWSTPVRSTPERARRLALQVDLERKEQQLRSKNIVARRAIASAGVLATVIVACAIAALTGIVKVSAVKWPLLLALLGGLAVPIGLVVARLGYQWRGRILGGK